MSWNEDIKKQLKYCGESVYIGENTIFTNPREVVLHDRVRIDPFCLVTTALEVGSDTQITAYVMLGGGNKHKITLGRWCFIGYGSKLFCASEDYSGDHGPVNEFWNPGNKIYRGDIKFNNYSGVASNCLVMPGVELPEGCTIGAGGFIYSSKPLQPWSVMLGSWENGKYQLKLHKHRNKEEVLKHDP